MQYSKKRKRLVPVFGAIIIALIAVFIYLEFNYSSIEKTIENNYESAKIYKVDDSDNLVLFSTNDDKQYYFGMLKKIGPFYFQSEIVDNWVKAQPHVLIISYIKDIGNIVWGFFDLEGDLYRIEIEYYNSTSSIEYQQTIVLSDKLFFDSMPKNLTNTDFSSEQWYYNLKLYNSVNEIVYEIEDMFFIYERNGN